MSAVLSGGPISFAVANTVELRSGTSPQALRVYNTYTDASNYERATFSWASNTLSIGTENAGTGVARSLRLVTGGTARWVVSSSGDFVAFQNNTYDFGAPTTAARNIYAGTAFILGDGVTAPTATVGVAKIFVDTADGDLKIIFGDGTVKTIVVDT